MIYPRKPALLICLLLLAAALAVYAPVLRYGFVLWDDDDYVVKNQIVQRGLTEDGALWALTTTYSCNWHPLTWFSHMLDCELFGLNAWGHHLTSILLHLLNTLLLFILLRLMTGANWRSGFVAGLFALHPLHVESVAWVAERKDVLSALFWMLTLLGYAAYARKNSRPRYGLTLALFALGLMAKPMLVSLPFVLLLLDYWPLNRKVRLGALFLEKIPFFLLSACSCAGTFAAQNSGGAVMNFAVLPLSLRVQNALISWVAYVWEMIWPMHLALIYPFPESIPLWKSTLAAALLIGVSIGVLAQGRNKPYLPVGWFWYLGTLVPVIGLVQVGSAAMADRYTYLPLIGLFIIAAWGGADLLAGADKAVPAFAGIAVLGVLAWLTWHQTAYWKNSVSLFERAAAISPGSFVAATNAGTACSNAKDFDAAITHFQAALKIHPDDAQTHNNLGAVLNRKGETREAIAHWRTALRSDPACQEARYNLAVALTGQGDFAEAVANFTELLSVMPDFERAHFRLGVALDREGRHEAAVQEYQAALRLNPNDQDVIGALKKIPQPTP